VLRMQAVAKTYRYLDAEETAAQEAKAGARKGAQ
jgi:Tfp pilus assembly protein PilO